MKRMQSRIMAFILAAVMALSFMAAPLFATEDQAFKDVPKSAWYHGYVMMLYEKGIVKGYGSTGEYRPDNKLSREHAAKMITLAAGLPYKGKKANFPDVDKDGEMSAYIAALVENGAVQGFPSGKFKPLDNIQRGHAAKMVALAFDLKEGDMTQALTDLPDDADVKTAIQILESNGVVKGFGGTKLFKPEEEINRAEFAKILCIAMVVKAIEKAEDDPSPANIAAAEVLLGKLPKGQDGPTQDYLTGRLEGLEEEPLAPGPGGGDPKPQQVSAVTITTDPEDVRELDNYAEVMVTLTTETAGATIYYTLDGDPPTTSSTMYNTEFLVRSGTTDAREKTIRAIAVKAGMTNSAVASLTITFKAAEANLEDGITGRLGESYAPSVMRSFSTFSPSSNRPMDLPVNNRGVDQVWAVPIEDLRYIEPTVFRNMTVFNLFDQRQFNIPSKALDFQNSGYVFILANSEADKKDKIVSFLSIKVGGDYNLINLPLNEISGVMNLGEIEKGSGVSKNEGVSNAAIQALSGFFSNDDPDYLKELALASNALKVLKNYYINDSYIDDKSNDKYYDFHLTHNFGLNQINGCDLQEYTDLSKLEYHHYEIIMSTNQGQNILKMLRPSEAVSGYDGEFDPDNPIELETGHNFGSWYSYFYAGLFGLIPENFWTLGRIRDGIFEPEAWFDFSMHSFLDENSNPLGYVPKIIFNVDDGVIESVTVKWYYNDGNKFTEVVASERLKKSIFGMYVQHENSFEIPITDPENTAPFIVDENVVMWDLTGKIADAKVLLGDNDPTVEAAELFFEEALILKKRLEYLPYFSLYYQTFGVHYSFFVMNSEANSELIDGLEAAKYLHIEALNQAINGSLGG